MTQEAKSYYALGYAYDLSGDLKSAIDNYEFSRHTHEILDDKEEVASCMNAKGVATYFKGDYELALDYYLSCLEYNERHNIKSVISKTLNNLEVIYRVNSKNREAISIYQRTLKLSKSENNQIIVGTSYFNLGVAYNFESELKIIVENSLREKDTILREVQHRVKNNLQVISALLTLQSKHLNDELAIEALMEGQTCVQSMALIHQDLYQHDNLKGVNTKDYFEKLIENLIHSY